MEDVSRSEVTEESTPKEVLAAGGVSRSRRPGSGQSRYGHRRSPNTGHRVRRNKTPEPNFVTPPELEAAEKEKKERVKRSLSSPGDVREPGHKRISSSEDDDERKSRKTTRPKNDPTKSKLESSKRWSAVPLTPLDNGNDVRTKLETPKPALRTRSKSRGREEKDDKNEEKSSWWKSWPSWTQRIRGKSLERELGQKEKIVVPPRRNRSLERPPVIKEKEKRAAKKEKEEPPVAKKRSKSKTRTISDEERRPSIEDSSDEFWKPEENLRKRRVEKKKEPEKKVLAIEENPSATDDSKQLVLVESKVEQKPKDLEVEKGKSVVATEPAEKASIIQAFKEIKQEWRYFLRDNRRELWKIRNAVNRCLLCFVVLVIYCGCGAFVFRFTEGAFESFYKCGVKRVKREFVDNLWQSSHHMKEEEWKSLARRKLMEFEEQLHTAYEAGMMSYSGLKAWSFLNAFIYCLTVVTTIGYGHISPSTTTGRAITIVYAIFGIPMFLILLADFGKLFTRGIKFIWAFVRRVYYTGSCKKVRRTVPMQSASARASGEHLDNDDEDDEDDEDKNQETMSLTGNKDPEVMKGVQMVYDIATFRRPSQLPPGVTLDDAPPMPPPLPPKTHTPGDPPGTPALSTFAIDDEFNLPISVAIFILLVYIFCGATVFYVWESWGFFESFYFVFISMSTIGFGDFVPQNQMYMMASIVYLVFGLALTSMCINVVQEKLSDSFRQASAKIGATIGLRVAEEDGTVTPVAPAPVEIAEVHKTTPTPTHNPTPSAS
ncbi:uncharacterized protein LOC128989815 isoform X2 [Macrosteles quadrilineatus]|uniref:uncharacterized protein LOC128989815 isoform X2 n=1 Tax=Macrosteles quadrilineatus TaxID=74068 RepID=UPI0023E0F846|nr:uncharacterized protein LOC128989815 isoform X2 [Macrosteles quadrilineatus]